MLCKYVCMYVTDISSSHVDCFYFDLGRGKGKVGGQNRKWRKQQQRIRPFPVAQIASPRREFNIIGEGDGCCQMRSDVGQNMSKCVAFASQSEQKGSKRHKRQGGRVSECLHIFALAPSGTFSHWCAAATSQGGTMSSHEGQQDLAVNRYPISTVKARRTLSAERV